MIVGGRRESLWFFVAVDEKKKDCLKTATVRDGAVIKTEERRTGNDENSSSNKQQWKLCGGSRCGF